MSAKITEMIQGETPDGSEIIEVSQASTSVTITATTISAAATDNSYNDSGSGFGTAGFLAGDTVIVSGFATSANNITTGVITSLTAGKMIIGGADGDVITDEAAGESVTISKWATRRLNIGEVGSISGRVKARAYLSAAANSPNNTWAKVPIDTVDFDPSGIWDAVNDHFVPDVAGYYLINGRFRFDGTTTGCAAGVGFNGSEVVAMGPDFTGRSTGGSTVMYCNGSTDTIDLRAYTGAVRAYTTGDFDTYLEIIGPI